MDAHFGAFSFVDRITSVRNGTEVRGRYVIPLELDDFPVALVGEAVGQLAAWAAMAAVNFAQRPVAGLAGSIELLGKVRPGEVLELAANLESVDEESVAYGGTAHANGLLVIRLEDWVGPMLPLADLDDPQALTDRFRALSGPGAAPGGFCGLPVLALERTAAETGRQARATFQVPRSAPFFADHFPRRPVFPGSLLMHLNLELAATLVSELPPPGGGRWGGWTILDMKLRSFIPPGATLELEAKLKERSDASAMVALEARAAREIIATARLALKPEAGP